MPSLDLEQGPKSLSRYDVVGEHGKRPNRFVTHVALHYGDKCLVEADEEVSAVHMRPPLKQDDAMSAHVAGQVPLTNDEIKELDAWIEEVADEYHTANIHHSRNRQYIIDPPWEDQNDPNTGVRRYRRYSCTGFVLDAHMQVEIALLPIDANEDVDVQSLPLIDRSTIVSAYGENPSTGRLHRWGLSGNGPWRLALAAYVMHALNRSTTEIRQKPYRPQEGDGRF